MTHEWNFSDLDYQHDLREDDFQWSNELFFEESPSPLANFRYPSVSPTRSIPGMAPRRHRAPPPEVVDLTEDVPTSATNSRRGSRQQQAPPVAPPVAPSAAPSAAPQGRKRKRDEELAHHERVQKEPTPQPEKRGEGNTRIGQMQCIICMEAYTDATTGQCGHMFCHECLTRALLASERHGAGTCPTCRKPIHRKKKLQVIPINFMKKTTYDKKKS